MKLSEAIQALNDGKMLKNIYWAKEDFIYLKDGVVYDHKNHQFDFWNFIGHNYGASCALDLYINFTLYEPPYTIDDAFNDLKEIYAKYKYQYDYTSAKIYIIKIHHIHNQELYIEPDNWPMGTYGTWSLFPLFTTYADCEKAIEEIGKDKILKIAKTLKGIK